MKIHIVRAKESLHGLATKYNVPVERILEANPDIEPEQALTAGLKIFIPTGRVSLTRPAKEEAFSEIPLPDAIYQQELADESSAYQWDETIPQPTQYCDASYFPMQAESHFAPQSLTSMPPYAPVSAWNVPYQMLQTQSFPPQGSVPIQPYYYPYPFLPYPVHPYQAMQLSTDSYEQYDQYDDAEWEESEQESVQENVWTAKESSSVGG